MWIDPSGYMAHQGKDINDGLSSYGEGRGHHVMSKKALEDVNGYDLKDGITVTNNKLRELGVKHPAITGNQNKLYTNWVKNNPDKTLTIEDMKKIEIESMTRLGVPEDYATNAVNKEYERLKQLGITTPNNIPWNGANK